MQQNRKQTSSAIFIFGMIEVGRNSCVYVLVSKRIQLKSLRAVADFPIAKYGKYLIFSLFFTLFFRMLLSLSTRFSYFFFKCGFTFSVNFRGHAIRMRFSRGTKAELWVPVIWQLNGRERVIMVPFELECWWTCVFAKWKKWSESVGLRKYALKNRGRRDSILT